MADKWAGELFKCGYNCAQSVFAARAAKFGIDTDTALKLSAPLGAGVGRMREVCGAFAACAMLLGLKKPPPNRRRSGKRRYTNSPKNSPKNSKGKTAR